MFEGLLYQLVYNLKRHRLLKLPVRHWLILVCLAVPVAAWLQVWEVSRLTSVPITLGAGAILVGIWWAEQQRYVRFVIRRGGIVAPEVQVRPWYVVLVPALLLLLLGPVWMGWLDARSAGRTFALQVPVAADGWTSAESFAEWKPRYVNPAQELLTVYEHGRHSVGLYLAHYRSGVEGSELINTQNLMIPQKHPVWRQPTNRSCAPCGLVIASSSCSRPP